MGQVRANQCMTRVKTVRHRLNSVWQFANTNRTVPKNHNSLQDFSQHRLCDLSGEDPSAPTALFPPLPLAVHRPLVQNAAHVPCVPLRRDCRTRPRDGYLISLKIGKWDSLMRSLPRNLREKKSGIKLIVSVEYYSPSTIRLGIASCVLEPSWW